MLDTLSSLIPSQADLLWNLATSAAGYVLMSLALLRLSRALSLPHPAFAWIPFLNYYRLGQIADLYTDNRMTDDEERAAPFYKPSALRRKTLGYSIAIAAILFMVAYNMSEWREFVGICKKKDWTDIVILVVTFALTVIFDLVVAIVAGLVIALIFRKVKKQA